MATFKKRSLFILSLFLILPLFSVIPFAQATANTVETTTINEPLKVTGTPFQNHVFYDNGRWWAFYGGDDFGWETSTDGSTWTGGFTIYGTYRFALDYGIWHDAANHRICVVHTYYSADRVSYRQGTLNVDGTITWNSAEVVVYGINGPSIPTVCIDSAGYPWVSWWCDVNGGSIYAMKATALDGSTWSTDSSLSWLSATGMCKIVPLESGKMLAIKVETGAVLKSRLYNGVDTWGNEVSASTSVSVNAVYFDAVSRGSRVGLTFVKSVNFNVVFVEYVVGSGWGAEETVHASSVNYVYQPSICTVGVNRYVVFYFSSATTLMQRERRNGSWGDEAVISNAESSATGLTSCFSSTSGYVSVMWYEGAGSPWNIRFYTYTPLALSSTVTISDMNAGNWLFAEYKYYTVTAIYTTTTSWTILDRVRVDFNDTESDVQIQYDIADDQYRVIIGDEKVVIRKISAANITAQSFRLVFGLYLTKDIMDTYDCDVYAWANSTAGLTYWELVQNNYFNIYNLGGRTEYRELGDTSLSNHPIKSDPFDLQVTGGVGGDIEVNVTYRNLQQVSLLAHLIIPTNRIGSQYAGEWSAEYGVYYYADGFWTKGWNVKLEFSNGFVSNKDFWVFVHAQWYRNNGVLVGSSEYFSSFFRPGLVNGTTVWVDLWFSNTNSSTAGGGRVSAEYYGMKDAAPWFAFWYSDWGPMLANQTMSYYEMPLLDWDENVISTKDIELIKVYSRLYKTSSSGDYTVEVKSPEVFDRKIARGDFVGIPTPPFVPPKVMDMPQGGMFGLLQTFLASIVAAITQALSPAFATCIAILDGIFAWAGWPGGFTQITTWISQMAGFMISAMGWMMTMLTGLFGFFTVTVPAMLYLVTTALTMYIDMIGKFWGFFTGLFGTGFDVWNDFGGTQWVTIGIMIYPMYLLLLWTEHGLAPVMVHLDFWGGLIMGLVNIAISLAGLVWSFISGLIENIPVVE